MPIHSKPHSSHPSHPYPYGMMMSGRAWDAGSSYRFGYNTQESVDEVSGVGIHYTAPYWDYDPRVVTRWNRDPVVNPWQSPYAINNDNPIIFSDPLGLFGSRKEAREYRREHDTGGRIRLNNDGNYSIDNKKAGTSIYQDAESGKVWTAALATAERSNHKSEGILFGIADANFLANYLRYSPILPNGAPNLFAGAEAIYIDGGVTTTAEADAGFIFILAGPDKGQLVPYKELAGGAVSEIGIGAEVGRIDYFGKAKDFRKSNAMGARTKAWIGPSTGIGGGLSAGVALSDKPTNGDKRTMAIGLQLSISISTPVISGGVNRGNVLNTTEPYPNEY